MWVKNIFQLVGVFIIVWQSVKTFFQLFLDVYWPDFNVIGLEPIFAFFAGNTFSHTLIGCKKKT
jgi:hypothetical protein